MFPKVYAIVFEGRIVYVGATTKRLNDRRSTHRWHLQNRPSNCPKLYKFLADKEWENFDFVVLEECSRDNLWERERYFIERFNCIDNGLNSPVYCGGANNPVAGPGRSKGCSNPSGKDHYKAKRIECISTKRKFDSLGEAAAYAGISRAAICHALKRDNGRAGGYLWRYL